VNNVQSFAIIFLELSISVIVVAVLIALIRIKFEQSREILKEENRKFAIETEYDPEKELILLDIFIMDCFTAYQTIVLSPQNLKYINDDKQVEIIKQLAEIVDSRMSDTLKYKMSKYYNKEALNEVIAEKIYSAVVTYVVQFNSVK